MCSRVVLSCTSKSSAKQRKGRTGRTNRGHLWRLYTNGTYDARPDDHPVPILRSDLAWYVLGLVKARPDIVIQEHPFLDAPSNEQIWDTHETLMYLRLLDLGPSLRESKITEEGEYVLSLGCTVNIGRLMMIGKIHNVEEDCLNLAAVLELTHPAQILVTSVKDSLEKKRSHVFHDGDLMAYIEARKLPVGVGRDHSNEAKAKVRLQRHLRNLPVQIFLPEPQREERRLRLIDAILDHWP